MLNFFGVCVNAFGDGVVYGMQRWEDKGYSLYPIPMLSAFSDGFFWGFDTFVAGFMEASKMGKRQWKKM